MRQIKFVGPKTRGHKAVTFGQLVDYACGCAVMPRKGFVLAGTRRRARTLRRLALENACRSSMRLWCVS